MPTLVSNLHRTVEKFSEQTALVYGDVKIEYGRFMEAVKRLAQGLKTLGINKGDRVAVLLPNVPHFCISYYAILELGAVVVPLDIMSTEEEINFYLGDCGAQVLISWIGFQSQVMPVVPRIGKALKVIFLGDRIPQGTIALTELIAKSSSLLESTEPGDGDLAVINYTSGIVTESFGAELSHAALVSNATICCDMLRISSEEKLIAVLPLFHPLGQTLVMNTAFSLGAVVVLVPRFSSDEIISIIKNREVTMLAGVPAMFRRLASAVSNDLPIPSLKYCVSYGGRLSEEIIKDFEQKYDALILEAYGLTEAGPLVSCNRINRDRKIGSVGLPLIGVEVQIRAEDGSQLRPGNSGEIWINSPSAMNGYYNRPLESEKRLKEGWLFTGDIGYLDEDHYLYVQERKADIIIKGGFHIFPGEIEQVVSQHPAVFEAAVVGVPDPNQGFEVKAFVVLKENQNASEADLIGFCQGLLPKYKCPRFIQICPSLPKSATGRVLKYKLQLKAQEEQNSRPPDFAKVPAQEGASAAQPTPEIQ